MKMLLQWPEEPWNYGDESEMTEREMGAGGSVTWQVPALFKKLNYALNSIMQWPRSCSHEKEGNCSTRWRLCWWGRETLEKRTGLFKISRAVRIAILLGFHRREAKYFYLLPFPWQYGAYLSSHSNFRGKNWVTPWSKHFIKNWKMVNSFGYCSADIAILLHHKYYCI